MRAGIYRGIRTLAVEDVPDPVAGPGDVVLDVAACGICGSDLHSYAEGAWIAEGMGMGHEFAGHVREVGAGVEGLAVGDAVAVNPFVSCGRCEQCAAGRTNLCADASNSAGTAFADQILVHDVELGRRVFAIPDGVSVEESCLLEPLSVAVRSVALSGARPGHTVAVLGLGAIGQCVVQVLRAEGISSIIAIDKSTLRLQRALASGASIGVDGTEPNLVDVVQERTSRTISPFHEASGVDVVIECAGAAALLPMVLRAVKAGGSVVLVGLFSRSMEIDANIVVQKEVRLLGSFAYAVPDVQRAFDLIATKQVDMASLITHRRPLDELDAAFNDQLDSEASIKVMVTPRE